MLVCTKHTVLDLEVIASDMPAVVYFPYTCAVVLQLYNL